ncbi:hypothetical protein AOQ84DRAFT_365089 [Glonium stellatum]|uniref:Uncharacterized protein n=1 Tax=Glonium stellatum TaxID=574774 RepID=A0A8E2EZ17_9PEZI|nr:hypothetical protein AOQ84DRAFT_365089 [Glonium stellatum]
MPKALHPPTLHSSTPVLQNLAPSIPNLQSNYNASPLAALPSIATEPAKANPAPIAPSSPCSAYAPSPPRACHSWGPDCSSIRCLSPNPSPDAGSSPDPNPSTRAGGDGGSDVGVEGCGDRRGG